MAVALPVTETFKLAPFKWISIPPDVGSWMQFEISVMFALMTISMVPTADPYAEIWPTADALGSGRFAHPRSERAAFAETRMSFAST